MAFHADDSERGSISDLLSIAGSGALRLALLFGSAAVALAIFLTPLAQKQAERTYAGQYNNYGPGIDRIATGAVRSPQQNTRTYTVRRSVLQSPNEICIIGADGVRTGC